MIQVNELRIGNLVTSKTWKGAHKIDSISLIEDGFQLIIKGYAHDFIQGKYVEIEPIPLTEEWLVKLGLQKSYNEWVTADFKFCMEVIEGELFFTGGEGVKLSRSIEHVHQLQNLYYSLTVKELTL